MTGELMQTPHGLVRDIGADGGKALCHPTRSAHSNGLCAECSETYDVIYLDKNQSADKTARALSRNIEFVSGIARAAATLSAQMKDYGTVARYIVETNLPQYAAIHMRAAEVAAEDGDAKPAQWALERAKPGGKRVIEPEDAAAKGPVGGGVQVMIGVQLGNVPRESVQATVVELPKGEDDAS